MLADLAAAGSDHTRLAGQAVEAAEFSHDVNAVLLRTLHFDGWCLFGLVPETGGRTAQFSGRGTEQTAEMARNEELMSDVNKYRTLAVAAVPAGWLSREHPAARHSFRLNEILVPLGFHSEIRLVLREHGRLWGGLALFRESPHRQFNDDDVAALCALAGPLTSAVREYPVRPLGRRGSAPGAGVVALSPDNRLLAVSSDAQKWLDDLLPGGEDETNAGDVTRMIFDAAHAVRRDAGGLSGACVRTVSGHWLRVEGTALPLGAADVAVLLHRAPPRELIETLALHHCLSPRESEIARLIVDGLASKQIARELGISLLTVNDHLRSVYRRCGASGREELFGRLG